MSESVLDDNLEELLAKEGKPPMNAATALEYAAASFESAGREFPGMEWRTEEIIAALTFMAATLRADGLA